MYSPKAMPWPMFLKTPLPFVKAFVDELHTTLERDQPGHGLSRLQRLWLALCLTGMLVTNSVCWARWERASLGAYSLAALAWVFRHAKIPWECLLRRSVTVLLRNYRGTHGSLVVDDSDKKRGKMPKRIFKAHKLHDKTSGGYITGQPRVLLVLVTAVVTLPVGFAFYLPDPALTAWRKENAQLKKQGVAPQNRPPRPARNPAYPTTQELALALRAACRRAHPTIAVQLVLADALYGTHQCMEQAATRFGTQVISPLPTNQQVRFRPTRSSLEPYVTQSPGVPQRVRIRGGKEVTVRVRSARLDVEAHRQKRLVVALKYPDEMDYRSVVASDLSWRTLDIVQDYTLRWLVEVFLADWKEHEGWGQLTTQPDEDGSSRSLILSLLLDHCLLCHPHQRARLEHKLPACTVGSLPQRTRADCLLACIRGLIWADTPEEKLHRLSQAVEEAFQLAPSKKHLSHRDLGRLEPTPTLKYRAQIA
jgi:DDE superfamily endonuclease